MHSNPPILITTNTNLLLMENYMDTHHQKQNHPHLHTVEEEQ
jgi:hypothetical protein